MPDDLYDRDILAWSEREAALLRRLARGERVNDVDWAHLVEAIEDVGLSERNAVRSCLERLLLHLLKLRLWPDDPSVRHWRTEAVAFQRSAARRFAPSMRRRIDLDGLYRDAVDRLQAGRMEDEPALRPPETCPFELDALLTEPWGRLETRAREAGQGWD